jgi:uncharacterized coiled-coil protein SlyX
MTMEQEWIRDRRPTAADGERNGDVRMKSGPSGDRFHLIHWSHVGAGVPWQHTCLWFPPAEPAPTEADRIDALEQRVAEVDQTVETLQRLVSFLDAKLSPPAQLGPTEADRIDALEQRVVRHLRDQDELIAALANRLKELEAQMRPTAETFEQPELSYQRAKAEQLRSQAALLLAQANLVEAGQ